MSQHEDVLICTECRSTQPDRYAIAQLSKGFDQPPCKYCGGVTVLTLKANLKQTIKRSNEKRGLVGDPDALSNEGRKDV